MVQDKKISKNILSADQNQNMKRQRNVDDVDKLQNFGVSISHGFAVICSDLFENKTRIVPLHQ